MIDVIFKIMEFAGMALSIMGALYMSKNMKTEENTMFKSGLFFFMSNFVMIGVALYHGIAMLAIQMLFFFSTSIAVLLSHTNDKKRTLKFISQVLFTLVILFALFYDQLDFSSMSFKPIEIIAAIIAITGSFLLKTHSERVRIIAFISFLIADTLYIKVGFDSGMYFFMAQAAFFLYTSGRGIKCSLKNIKEEAVMA